MEEVPGWVILSGCAPGDFLGSGGDGAAPLSRLSGLEVWTFGQGAVGLDDVREEKREGGKLRV